ncbi:hypothetical protein JCM19241_1350 [Vibrio ishigakensis]|uniref:Uncharacterized protein n=1 Tax=Vibrio ishigakensis TaxID=1481914 RepID=A0A0B8QDJ4_9VIBR|nr:hypothetical protein JCM19241_1350 [Vibrio ishigakensis]
MLRRLLYPLIGLFIIACIFFGEEMWQFISGDPIRDIQEGAQNIIKAFNRFISG